MQIDIFSYSYTDLNSSLIAEEINWNIFSFLSPSTRNNKFDIRGQKYFVSRLFLLRRNRPLKINHTKISFIFPPKPIVNFSR